MGDTYWEDIIDIHQGPLDPYRIKAYHKAVIREAFQTQASSTDYRASFIKVTS
jgi:hypothetical protein